jgi:hypothetical protein
MPPFSPAIFLHASVSFSAADATPAATPRPPPLLSSLRYFADASFHFHFI